MPTSTATPTADLNELVGRLNPQQRADYDRQAIAAFRDRIDLREHFAIGRTLTTEQVARQLAIPQDRIVRAALAGELPRDQHTELRQVGRAGSPEPKAMRFRDGAVVNWIFTRGIDFTIPATVAMTWATNHEREASAIRRQVAEWILAESAKAGDVDLIETVRHHRDDAAREQAAADQARERAAWARYVSALSASSMTPAKVKALDETMAELDRSLDDARSDLATITTFSKLRADLQAAIERHRPGADDQRPMIRQRMTRLAAGAPHLFTRTAAGEFQLLSETA